MTGRDVLPAAIRAADRLWRTASAAGFGARLTAPLLVESARTGRVTPRPPLSFAPFAAAVPGVLLIVLTVTDHVLRGRI